MYKWLLFKQTSRSQHLCDYWDKSHTDEGREAAGRIPEVCLPRVAVFRWAQRRKVTVYFCLSFSDPPFLGLLLLLTAYLLVTLVFVTCTESRKGKDTRCNSRYLSGLLERGYCKRAQQVQELRPHPRPTNRFDKTFSEWYARYS